ncbi:ferric reductase-like transmembrane domain-containing protein [Brevundimonas sp. R86498]|uniref:ferredoxin reductase family protein n=1 Tax=Brevundimonas sp. R86498 TaxID=3093845 RepID=UPI0037CB52E7
MTPMEQQRRMTARRPTAWPVVAGIIAISLATTALAIPASSWLSTAAVSLACGVAALSLMAGSAILGGRWGWVESAFGGLDRVYTVHKWLGIYALALASIHLLFKADLRGWDTAAILVLPSDWARLARQASFVGLMLIAILALNRNISYGVWRWWHRLSGPIFVVVVVHWLSIKSPILLASPAGLWLAALASLAVLAALWKLTLYPFFARHAEYRVVEVIDGGSAVQIDLLPTGRGIDFTPGQFGFLRMKAPGLREPHPFTIAAAGSDDGRVSFVIRSLGDFTARLVADVRVGMRAEVHAPYGRFTRAVGANREIWVAGGVGISPFIAWMDDAGAGGFARVTLFYFYTPGRGFPSVERLTEMAGESGVEFVPVSSGPTAERFKRRFSEIALQGDPSTLDISVCGPAGLADAVAALAVKNGLSPRSIRSEQFAFR